MRGYSRILAVLVFCALTVGAQASADVILDNFDDGNLTGWSIIGNVSAVAAPGGFGSGYVMFVQAGDSQTPGATINFLPNLGQDTLTFDAYVSGGGAMPAAVVQVGSIGGQGTQDQWLNANDQGTYTLSLGGMTSHTLFVWVNPMGDAAGAQVYFDNFTLTPEPATLGLLSAAAMAMLARRRRVA